MAPHLVHQFLLKLATLGVDLREAGADDHQGAHSAGGAVVHHAQHRIPRHGHDRQVHRLGQVANGRIRPEAADDGGLGVDGVDGPLKAVQDQGFQDAVADACRIAGGADHGHGFRLEEGPQRGRRRHPVAHLQPGHAGFIGDDGKVHLDFAAFLPFLDGEPRLLEDVAHRPVVGVRDGPEPGEAVPYRQQRQPLQQQGAQPLAVQGVVDRESDLGGGFVLGQVRAGGDDAGGAVVGPGDQQGQRGARIGSVAQGLDQLGARGRHGEEAAAPRFGRQPLEECPQGVTIFRPGQVDLSRRAIAQDQPPALRCVLVGLGQIARAYRRFHWRPSSKRRAGT